MGCCPIAARVFSLTWKLGLAATLAGGARYLSGAGSKAPEPVHEFRVEKGAAYSVLASVAEPAALSAKDARATVTYMDPSGATISKALHAGDLDLLVNVRAAASGMAKVTVTPAGLPVGVKLRSLGTAQSPLGQLGTAGHSTWQSAEFMELGRPVYASADERPYVLSGANAKENFDQLAAGAHWYRFDYSGPGGKLVHFNVDVLDRDVPVDVAVFTAADGKPAEYLNGRERYETEKSTNFHGLTKFAARVIAPGSYFVRVMGNHPWYKLETSLYEPPPYKDPKLAVRAAMDYIVRRGDSWHANVPRKGAVVRRDSTALQETRLCIACHPTHFSTRAELFAMKNGYPLRAKSSLQFLTERLANNPRPIYGRPDASWARMIHAPGNVLSRVAYLTDNFERTVTGERREELYRGIAGFLEMYWPGISEPKMESNGNLPRISGFEVAMHGAMLFEDLHKRTGQAKYKGFRDQIERVIADGKAVDMIDLCWKIDALAWLGRDKYAVPIAALAKELLSHQRPDGRWPMPFGLEETQYDFRTQSVQTKKIKPLAGDEGARSSDFQTWHALYALARAGFTGDDPRVRKAVDLCLSRQTESGAWQGNPDYKNFDTPFRDTQYAIMALATLYPMSGKPAHGWSNGETAPTKFDDSSTAALVAQLDLHWDRPAAPVIARIRRYLASDQPMVRFQAAVALGRFGDGGSVEALATALGDPSKMVQRGAAWSLRQIASRRPEARAKSLAAIRAALDSPNARIRWGATRIFNQHFKYLSEEWTLGERLAKMAGADPDPAVRMAAIQAMYQWWFWDRDTGHKAAIENALIAVLNREHHPLPRRNLIEAYYNTLDDNVRYLYGSWIPRIAGKDDKAAVENGHREMVRIQATRYRDAMRGANALGREGLLRSLYTHHVREGLPAVPELAETPPPATMAGHWVNGYRFAAAYDPLTAGEARFTSIGNDSEPPVFYADSAPVMNEAFLAALADPTAANVRGAARALTFLRNLKIEAPLADRLLALLQEGPAGSRADIAALAKAQLGKTALSASRLESMVRAGDAMTLDVVASIAAGANASRLPVSAVSERLRKTPPENRAFPALAALAAASPALRKDEAVVAHVLKGLNSKRPQPQQAAAKLVLNDPAVLAMPTAKAAWEGFPVKQGPYAIGGALKAIEQIDYAKDHPALPEARRILLAGFDCPVPDIRSQALNTLRNIEPLHKDAEIVARVAALAGDAERKVRASALSFQTSQLARSGRKGIRSNDVVDYFYFKEHVEPVLTAKGSDGHACANCHANHTLLKLNEPDEFGVLTLEKSRANFSAVTAMIDVADPAASLLLNKPIAPLDDAGTGASQRFSHGGGPRWSGGAGSAEYRAILRWIQGARLDSGSPAAAGAGGGGR